MIVIRIVYELKFTAPTLGRGELLFTIQEIVTVLFYYLFPRDSCQIVVNLALTFPVTIGIVSLFVFQCSILVENMTSYEESSYNRYKKISKNTGLVRLRLSFRLLLNFCQVDWIWFYDFGGRYNISSVMGGSIFDWFIPQTPYHIRHR